MSKQLDKRLADLQAKQELKRSKRVNSKQKGKRYERECAEELSEIFQMKFERVPDSGAFIGGKNLFRSDKLSNNVVNLFEGDLIPPEPLQYLKFECKFYKDINWNTLLNNKNPTIDEWIEQASKITPNKLWIIIFKVNQGQSNIIIDKDILSLKVDDKKLKINDSFFVYKNKYIISRSSLFFNDNKDFLLNYYKLIDESKYNKIKEQQDIQKLYTGEPMGNIVKDFTITGSGYTQDKEVIVPDLN